MAVSPSEDTIMPTSVLELVNVSFQLFTEGYTLPFLLPFFSFWEKEIALDLALLNWQDYDHSDRSIQHLFLFYFTDVAPLPDRFTLPTPRC